MLLETNDIYLGSTACIVPLPTATKTLGERGAAAPGVEKNEPSRRVGTAIGCYISAYKLSIGRMS